MSTGMTNYFGKTYYNMNENYKIKSTIRNHLKTEKFHLIICSQKYHYGLLQFVKKITPVENLSKAKLFSVACLYADKRNNDASFLDNSLFFLQSNSLITREILKKELTSSIIEQYQHMTKDFDFVFPEYVMKNSEDIEQNNLIGNFDDVLSSNSLIPGLSEGELSEQEMSCIFPILPNYVNVDYFFAGIRIFLSLKSEIEEVCNKSLN